ncbi:MAG: VWA domain-containing protein [Bacteroides sp.]|nr:VWA domain-containing protein [Bacteroides sp.]
MKKVLTALTALVLALSLSACSQSEGTAAGESPTNGAIIAPSGGASTHPDAAADGIAPAEGAYDADLGEADKTMAPEGDAGDFDHIADDEAFDAEKGEWEEIYGGNGIPEAAGTLTAGEWIDNEHYGFWQELFQKADTGWESYRNIWQRSYCARTFVTVSQNGRPVENSLITLYNANNEVLWQAKTDNEGKAYLFYGASELSRGELTVTADFGGEAVISSADDHVSFLIDAPEDRGASKSLDMALVVDTTGSMSDELSYLQKELESVIERVAKDNGNIPVRLSVDFYRDNGDDYVVRDFDFTEDISEAIRNLNDQTAEGGGDYPENVNAALHTAINELSWEESSTKLLFIVLDAPPHSDDGAAVAQMNTLTEQAAAKGIRVIPVLASGGDKETEFLMRDFALKTGGSYLFLTDDSGVSVGGHIEPTIGSYQVEKLNDLMVKVADRYLRSVQSAAEYAGDTDETSVPTEAPIDTRHEETTVPPILSDGKLEMILTDTTAEGLELTGLEFQIKNGTEHQYYYGLYFNVEKLDGTEWTEIPPTEDFAVIEIAMILEPGQTHSFNAPVYTFWKDLEAGEYRVVLNLSSEEGNETLYGLFEVE